MFGEGTERRLRDIGDLQDLLEDGPAPVSRSPLKAMLSPLAGVLLLALGILSFVHFREAPPQKTGCSVSNRSGGAWKPVCTRPSITKLRECHGAEAASACGGAAGGSARICDTRLFARFPFYNMENLHDAMGTVILRPGNVFTISSELHSLALAARNDLWYSGGGAFRPWTFGYTSRATHGAKSVANLYDVSVGMRLRPNVTLTLYTAYAQGCSTIAAIYPNGRNSIFGYSELEYWF
jgi:hypothetical protein